MPTQRNATLWHNLPAPACGLAPPPGSGGSRLLRIIRRMSTKQTSGRPHVLIVGCGFGGLEAARKLQRAQVDITLVDKTNHHLFQPLLYQVATAGLAAPSIAAPVRLLFRKQPNVTTLLGEVTQIDPDAHTAQLADGTVLAWDHLIVAAGSTHSYFGNDAWEPMAPGLKTLADAFEIRRRVLVSFEAAEIESDPARRRALLTFAVIGAGPTGVEMAGTLAEIARHTAARACCRPCPSR
jgi:NADH dehydrogenase